MTPAEFVAKWKPVELPERAASQEHFLDLCRLLDQPTPAEYDPTGEEYQFEKGVSVTGPASRGTKGIRGSADVWWRRKFGWEYKTKDKYANLEEAYRQLCQYREGLENPPLLIVSDISRTEIHTNFTGTAKQIHVVNLEDMASPAALDLLRRVFTDPESFRPDITSEGITTEIAAQFAELAIGLGNRGHDPHDAAHFLMKCMFCLFAEDVGLLPPDLFKDLLIEWREHPADLAARMTALFKAMRTGGAFGVSAIPWFNGNLFDESRALELTAAEAGVLILAATHDWGAVEPAIFGTLFERSLDPEKRAQIGAHYTSREDIMLVVEPVIVAPLRRRWEEVVATCDQMIEERAQAIRRRATGAHKDREIKPETITDQIHREIAQFHESIASARVLDPACGSGNFLYVAIQQLLELEKDVISYAARLDIALSLLPQVRPTQLYGIEINLYAAELAQIVTWIGYLQWMRDNGFRPPNDPILQPLDNIQERDAVLDQSDPENPGRAVWPDVDYIIGNPPFLGSQRLSGGLGEEYATALRGQYDLPNTSDLCCYWFDRARQQILTSVREGYPRIGLLATQGIRGVGNRTVLENIQGDANIFCAWSDRNWILDGAQVHVSIICFDDGTEETTILDGVTRDAIHADLRSGVDVASARTLPEARRRSFQGPVKVGKFELTYREARQLLGAANPHGESNAEVMSPYITGAEVAGRAQGEWIIDFHGLTEAQASLFEAPFERVRRLVKPERDDNNDERRKANWWLHGRSGTRMRAALRDLPRYIVCCRHMKDWIFRFVDGRTFPDAGTVVFAFSEYYHLGVLQSSIHELWGRAQISQVREAESGFRYTNNLCFERFPFPWPLGTEPEDDPAYKRMADAMQEFDEQREQWFNPAAWIDQIAAIVDRRHDFADVLAEARPLMRQSTIMAGTARVPRLRQHTLSALYADRPTWVRNAVEQLDRAVLAAYATTDPDGEWDESWSQVWKERGAGETLPNDSPVLARRTEIDELVLANLLRLNDERAAAE